MGQVTLTIHGHSYGLACDDGQEERLHQLAAYVDERMGQIAKAGGASSESHLLMLTTILLADEVFDLKAGVAKMGGDPEAMQKEEELIVQAIDVLADRIDSIAERIHKA